MDYFKRSGNKIICMLCQHHCRLKNEEIGVCGVNKNINGELKTLVYGYLNAIHLDPIEKKPLYHVLPSTTSLSIGTSGCNFRCPFCQNWQLSQNRSINRGHFYSPQEIVDIALRDGANSISYTYNEPTIFYPYAHDIALLAHKNSLKNIYVTNGYESKETIEDMSGVIDAVNVDLKSFSEQYYKRELKGSLSGTLESLKIFKQNGIWVEVTTLIIPNVNDSREELMKIAKFIADELGRETPWHISAFHPDYKMLETYSTPIETMRMAKEIGEDAGLYYIYLGNIQSRVETICPGCGGEVVNRQKFTTKNISLKDGRCPHCSREIEGIWS